NLEKRGVLRRIYRVGVASASTHTTPTSALFIRNVRLFPRWEIFSANGLNKRLTTLLRKRCPAASPLPPRYPPREGADRACASRSRWRAAALFLPLPSGNQRPGQRRPLQTISSKIQPPSPHLPRELE